MQIESNYNTTTQQSDQTKKEKTNNESNGFLEAMKNANLQEQEDDLKTQRKLVEDIKSVMRTGLTVEELERLEKLIQMLKEKVKQSSGNDPEENKAIDQSIQELEQAIMAIKKRINGEAIIEAKKDDKNKEVTNENGETKLDTQGFMARLDDLSKELTKLKENQEKLTGLIHKNDGFKLVKDMKEFEEENL